MNICVVSFIISKAFQSPLTNLLSLLQQKEHQISLVCSSIENIESTCKNADINWVEIPFHKPKNILLYGFLYFFLQIHICYHILKQAKNHDSFLFFMEGVGFFPMMLVKILNKPLIWMIPSSILMVQSSQKRLPHNIMNYFQSFSAHISTIIILYSKNLIYEWNLQRFKNKIHIAHEHFLDFSIFKKNNSYEKRSQIIGHIGRLSDEKGTLNFVKAIPLIIQKNKDLSFYIGGDGDLSEEVKQFIYQHGLEDYVKYAGWISRKNLPDILNNLKLLVLPSKTEGLPNMMIESMACGTPVLATPVGSIPDFITDEKTGFILKDTSPDQIRSDIIRAIQHPRLLSISTKSYELIQQQFHQDQSVENLHQILTKMNIKP